MESVLIEYLRFNDLNTAVLRGGDPYILAHKDLPVKQVSTPVNQDELLHKLSDCLRYKSDISAEEKWKTIVEISNVIKPFFIDFADFGYKNCQLDVVLSASELGLLPFELLLDDNQLPWFADAEKNIVFTRRVRLAQIEKSFSWPFTPKVLFIYAHGGFQEVPFERHKAAFNFALDKWGGTNSNKVFKMLEQPTFEEFSAELKANDESGKQYTHVHVLAHGDLILDRNRPYDFEYGIRFGKGDSPTTKVLAIKELFESLTTKPFLVNYMICDGANFSNPLKADKNPVQVTHKAGVPMVLGSQYPLSMDGSVRITNKLYAALFNGNDIRKILTDIRLDLFKKKEEHHDWISLVAYIRLPEGYNDYLYKVALNLEMQNLKSTKEKIDAFLLKEKPDDDDFIGAIASFKNSIAALENKLIEIKDDPKYQNETLENLGLLGSAFKRLAELYFSKGRVKNENTSTDQKKALEEARRYYKKASDKNLSHHWSLVQYISLDIVLNQQISDTDYWYTARNAAKQAIAQNKNDVWAYGSLLELLFIDPDPLNQNEKLIDEALACMIEACNNLKQGTYSLETTRCQLNRYKEWWIVNNSYNITNAYFINNRAVLDKAISGLLTAVF